MTQQLLSQTSPVMEVSDLDFDISRTFSVLLAVLVIPVHLALMGLLFSISVVT